VRRRKREQEKKDEDEPMARAGLTPQIVTAYALDVLDDKGPAGLTLKAVAERAKVAPPSLYKHVRSLDDLRALMAIQALSDAADRIGAAVMGLAGDDALRAFLRAFRAYAEEHPQRHGLIESPPPSVGEHGPALEAASARLVETAFATVRGYGLEGDDLVHAVRALRAVVVGFVSLEHGGGYRLATDLDASFDFLAELLASGLGRRAGRGAAGRAASR
jgi:AcrR family transcriptional regulator